MAQGLLGHCEVDDEGEPVKTTIFSPRVAGGHGTHLQPILLHADRLNYLDENVVASLLKRYLELAEVYEFDRAVWLYLHARNAPIAMASGYVGAAFELLVRGYYERPENTSRSKLMPKPQWKEVSSALRASLETLKERTNVPAETLGAVDSAIVSGGLNRVSGTRLNTMFLTDLGIDIGDIERGALQARNDAAHANRLEMSDFEALCAYRALHTLFARAFFRLLGVDVRYIDYSTEGFPVKELEERQGPH